MLERFTFIVSNDASLFENCVLPDDGDYLTLYFGPYAQKMNSMGYDFDVFIRNA
ncbi:hypothetical protein HMI56_004646 [Coelomomyces lativittatus]|nr:hypothetical protein HMI56_004646 [Coelomomyces lativittatus]